MLSSSSGLETMYWLSILKGENLVGYPIPAPPSVHTCSQHHTKWTMASFLHRLLFSFCFLLAFLIFISSYLIYIQTFCWSKKIPLGSVKHTRPSSVPFDEEGTLSCCPVRSCPQGWVCAPLRKHVPLSPHTGHSYFLVLDAVFWIPIPSS